jgi:hypothetical protein
MSSHFIPMKPRASRFRIASHIARLRRAEPLAGNVTPTTYPALEDGDPIYPEVIAPDLVELPGSGTTVATLARRPGGTAPDPPYRNLPSWPWGAAYPTVSSIIAGGGARAWDAAINALNRKPTVDLSTSDHWARSPRGAGMDLLARILSGKTWSLTGDINGVSPAGSAVWSAGSSLTVASTGTATENLLADGGSRGWLPWEIDVATPTGEDLDDWRLELQVLDGAPAIVADEVEWRNPIQIGLDAYPLSGRAAQSPRVVGQLVYRRDDGFNGIYRISAVPRTGDSAHELLPIELCGFQLYGSLIQGSQAIEMSGGVAISPTAFWAPEDWAE